jgi:PAS domain S-box-containing protein
MKPLEPLALEDFSSLFTFLPIGAYRSSPEGRMLRANLALVALNGYANEAEQVDSVKSIAREWYVNPGRRDEFKRLLERDGFVKGFESEIYRHKTRERIWISENAHVVRDAQGDAVYYEGTVEDITARMRMQESLRHSEEQMRLISSQIPGMVFVVHVDREGQRQYRFVSEGIRGIYGLEPEQLLADPTLLSRYRHPDDQERLEQDLKGVTDQFVNFGGEFRVVLPDGTVRWVLRRSCTAGIDETGQLRVGVLIDITDHKRVESDLLESETRWKLAMEGAGDGVWDWNLQTGEEFFSQRIRAMFGYADDELADLAAEMDRRTHPDDIDQMCADREAHFSGQTAIYRNEHRVQCKDGSWKWVLSRGMVIARDDEGKPLRMVGTHTDITELKMAEVQQRALEVQLRESQKMEAIGTLAGGVAHDFNNLLAAILGNLVLAREDVGPEHVAQESLNEINRAAIRARQLVQQILAFSRRQAQVLERQALLPLVQEALALMRSLLPAGVKMSTQLDGRELLVMADATQVQQVLMNLCTNAWQALQGRSGEIAVTLRSVRLDAARALEVGGISAGSYACLSVADNGPGMEADTQRRIFEPFFTTKAPGAGTGLGLAVVHGIVKAHQGAIAVNSRLGEGTRFDVYLPLASASGPVVARPPTAPVAPSAGATAGRHVVYIDDYEAMVFLVGRLLRKQGYRVSTFTSGESALAWMRANLEPIDLLVTDQNMPGMSGLELSQAVMQERPGQRIAIVSGHVNDKLLADAAALGVQEVMAKQDSMDALGQAIRQLLEVQLAAR